MKGKQLLLAMLVGVALLVGVSPRTQKVEAFYVPSAVKSVTAISISYAGNPAVAGTQTVSVAKANAILFPASSVIPSDFFECMGWGTITNNTTVTVTPQVSDACAATYTWKGMLVEYYPNWVKSSGTGSITVASGGTTGTATITSVNPAKTMVAWTGMTVPAGPTCNDNVSGSGSVISPSTVVLTNATTLTASLSAISPSSCNYVVGYSYLEFH